MLQKRPKSSNLIQPESYSIKRLLRSSNQAVLQKDPPVNEAHVVGRIWPADSQADDVLDVDLSRGLVASLRFIEEEGFLH